MKRKYSLISIMVLFCMSVSACGNTPPGANSNSGEAAQPASDRGQATLQIEGGKVSVEYGRPALNGRDLEKMIKPGQEWRMGSNAATKLTTDVDLKFGDNPVPKGKYVLKAKPVDQQKWLLIIQTEDEKPFAEVPLAFQKIDRSAENMTIELVGKDKGGSLVLHWGNLTLSTDFQKA